MNPGKEFEERVYNKLVEEVAKGTYGDKAAKVRRSPRYFSRDRDGYITFDISVEQFRQGADDPSVIWVWECKWSSSRAIEVGEIEQFHNQARQVSAHKLTLVSNAGFSKSVESYAKSNRIAISRLHGDDTLEPIFEDAFRDQRIIASLTFEDPEKSIYPFSAIATTGKVFSSFAEMVRHELQEGEI